MTEGTLLNDQLNTYAQLRSLPVSRLKKFSSLYEIAHSVVVYSHNDSHTVVEMLFVISTPGSAAAAVVSKCGLVSHDQPESAYTFSSPEKEEKSETRTANARLIQSQLSAMSP